jgi:hypothetical protein
VLLWTEATCELHATAPGVALWTRTHLVSGGGIGDQDAWLFDAIGFVRDVMNERLMETRRG